jgi:hypothetical protein
MRSFDSIASFVQFKRSLGLSTASATEAKKHFFLTPADLESVPFERPGGWGCGLSRDYLLADLERAAVAVHGEDGLRRKEEARRNRNSRAREKEAQAARALEELNRKRDAEELVPETAKKQRKAEVIDLTGAKPRVLFAGEQQQAKVTATAAPSAVSRVRSELTSRVKGCLTWDTMWSVPYQMASVPIKVTIFGVSPAAFAALIGRAEDAELKTLVKRGAWYSENVDNSVLFGAGWRTTMVGSGSKRGSLNSELGLDETSSLLKYAPAKQELHFQGYVTMIE